MQTTQLAHGKVTNANTLTIELIEPPGMPVAILLRGPQKPIDHHTRRLQQYGSGGDANPRNGSYRTSGPSSPEAAMRSPSTKV
jgi:hypothetical protein